MWPVCCVGKEPYALSQSQQDLNVYAEIRKSVIEPPASSHKPSLAKSQKTATPAVIKEEPPPAVKVTGMHWPGSGVSGGSNRGLAPPDPAVSTDNSMQDLTLIDNTIYKSMTYLPAGGADLSPVRTSYLPGMASKFLNFLLHFGQFVCDEPWNCVFRRRRWGLVVTVRRR